MNTEQALVEYARRSHENAERTTNAALRMEQVAGRLEREHNTLRSELQTTRKEMHEGFEALNAAVMQPIRQLAKTKFNPTDTGSHFLVPAQDLDAMLAKERQREDAATWRSTKRRARQLILAAAVGSATFGGEHLLKWLLHW